MTKQVLIIGFVWPEPKSSAAGSRMMQLIETFQSFDYKITDIDNEPKSVHWLIFGVNKYTELPTILDDISGGFHDPAIPSIEV